MFEYMIAVICAVAVSGIIMLVVFHRLKVLSFRTVASITLASLITAIIMPGIFNSLTGSDTGKADPTVLVMVTVASFVAYVVIVLILSILISLIIPKLKAPKRGRKPAGTDTDAKIPEAGNADGGVREKTVLEQLSALYFGDKPEDSKAEQPGDSKAEQPETAAASTAEPEAADQGISPYPAEAAAQETAADLDAAIAQETGPDADAAITQETGSDADAAITQVTGSDTDAALIPGNGPDQDTDFVPEDTFFQDMPQPDTDSGPGADTESSPAEEASEPQVAGDSYIEQIYLDYVAKNDETESSPEDGGEIAGAIEGKAEKSVDSSEIIDKMGIENKVYDSRTVTIEECITEAFRLKEEGDFEGAILYFMYALDKKPQKELTFWIILDICVMYKSLGQHDLALEILNSYYKIYGDMMGTLVRDEIIRNLTDVSA